MRPTFKLLCRVALRMRALRTGASTRGFVPTRRRRSASSMPEIREFIKYPARRSALNLGASLAVKTFNERGKKFSYSSDFKVVAVQTIKEIFEGNNRLYICEFTNNRSNIITRDLKMLIRDRFSMKSVSTELIFSAQSLRASSHLNSLKSPSLVLCRGTVSLCLFVPSKACLLLSEIHSRFTS